MSDVGANQAEIPMAILKSFYSHGNDDKAYSSDDFERYKRKNYCSELQGGRLNFYESGEPNYNTTTAVVKVEKRRGTNILILRCGPEGRMVIFLEFDCKQLTDEWQEALCRYTGQTHVPNPALRRVNSERPAVARRRNRNRARSRTTLPDIIVEQVDSDPQEAPLEAPQEAPPAPLVAHSETPQEAPLEAPPAPPLDSKEGLSAPHSPPGSPTEDRILSLTSDTSDTDSGPDSLRSRDADLSPTLADLAKNSVEKEFNLSDLQPLKVKDCGVDVIVKEAIPLCDLHVGDKIVLTNDGGPPMNAREMTEHIRTSPEQTIDLTIVRGAVCNVRKDECELGINIKGSQSVKLDTVDLILRACTSCCSLHYAEMPERSDLTITEINNTPVDIGSQQDQIAKTVREALDTSKGGLTLRLVSQSLLDALAEEDDDTHEEQAHDMVDE